MKKTANLINKNGKYRYFGRNYPFRALVGMLVFFLLMLINCFEYFSDAKEKNSDVIIVIDAGHGGNDPGKVSSDGIKEKDINLSIALKLKEELEKRGARVILTRDCDKCLDDEGTTNKKKSDMINRMETVNNCNATLLISIHQNSFGNTKVKGAQVFYYGSSSESRRIAESIQKMIKKEVDVDNNRVAKPNNDYYILRKSVCPAVIIECGFLSNPEEAGKLTDEEYQQKMASAIAKAVIGNINKKR